MKPTFALDLSRDSIALLHRTPKGWLPIGDVAFDAPDMAEVLEYLRKTALGLSPMGMACKIILPNSQILYTEVEAPGPSRNDKRRQIALALEGRTPYAVKDLVFDWSGKGATVKVAVIARETLAEAEKFVVEHRLNPVSFVAIPEEGAFVGEPWFGPTDAAETLLAAGETVDRDREPVTILLRDPPQLERMPEPDLEPEPDPEPMVGSQPEPASDSVAAALPVVALLRVDEDEDAPLPGLEEALNAALAEELLPGVQDKAQADLQPDTQPGPSSNLQPGDPVVPPQASLAEAAGALPSAGPLPTAVKMTPVSVEPEVEEAPFAHVTDTAAFPDGDDMAPVTKGAQGTTASLDDDIPPLPPLAAMAAFASRRASAGPAPGPMAGASRSDAGSSTADAPRSRLGGQPVPRPVAPPRSGTAGLVTAPSIPGTRPKSKGKPGVVDIAASTATGPTTMKSPARPGGTFGTAAPPRNRSGVVFMVLVALLLLFLALIAGWSSFFLARNGQAEVETGALLTDDADVPGVDDEMLADMQDPEGMTEPLPEADQALTGGAASLATETLPVNIGGDETLAEGVEPGPVAQPEGFVEGLAADEVMAGAEAQAAADAPTEALPLPPAAAPAAAAADVASAAPIAQPKAEPAPETAVTTELAGAIAPVEDQDEIFLSAMDAPPPALDALALPVPAAVTDAAPDAPMPPPAFGTVYQFDANGLLKPTPEGILSPEGVMLIAGKPPRLPPPRSDVAAAAALAAAPALTEVPLSEPPTSTTNPAEASLVTAGEALDAAAPDAAIIVPSDPAMAGFRPRSRPEGLTPATGDDDASLPADATTTFAGRRPLARPDSVLAAASASRPAEPAAETQITDLGAQGASLAAQAEADLAAAEALEAASPSVVAISKRPEQRPRDLSRAVEAAVAAAVRAPEPTPEPDPDPALDAAQPKAEVALAAAAPAPEIKPELKPEELDEVDEPETAKAAPGIPTKASVAKQATFKNAINLSKVNLIGTYGSDSKRTALVRQSNGRYKKVKVGDKIDGGTIKAITTTEVRYQKGGKLLTLKMPKA